MATEKNLVKNDNPTDGGVASAEQHQRHLQSHGNGFATQYPTQQPPVDHIFHPLAPPPKRAKMIEYPNHGSRRASSTNHSYPSAKTVPSHTHTVVPPMPQVPPTPVTATPSRPQKNPYSTSRGLRHFSMKVCEKVEEKGTTTYNEVADELVRELRQAEDAINIAAAARGEVPAKKRKKPSSGKVKKNHDDKNIRRRVYDALNVLMAMDIITKDKKEITWRGLPGSRVHDGSEGDGAGPGKRRDGLSRRQRVQQLLEEVSKRQEDIRRKRDCLQELMVQNVCFNNLLGRNHTRELEEQRGLLARNRLRDRSRLNHEQAHEQENDNCEVKEVKDEKIPLPFLIVSTDSRAVVQCEMCPKRTNVSFDFSLPFEINDDNEILKRLGMNHTSKEALQRSLPPDLFHYCNSKGLLECIARPR